MRLCENYGILIKKERIKFKVFLMRACLWRKLILKIIKNTCIIIFKILVEILLKTFLWKEQVSQNNFVFAFAFQILLKDILIKLWESEIPKSKHKVFQFSIQFNSNVFMKTSKFLVLPLKLKSPFNIIFLKFTTHFIHSKW